MVRRLIPLAVVLGLFTTACGSTASSDPRTVSEPFAALWNAISPQMWRSAGNDTFEVFICRVPADSTAAVYAGLPDRRTFTAADIVRALGDDIGAYFASISTDRYHPTFVAGGVIAMSRTDTPERCARAALKASKPASRAVLLVANAEHGATQPGGMGSPGVGCPGDAANACPAAQSQRWAYVGAVDFAPDRIARPPLDLIEHEIGHTLGWVHSGTAEGTGVEGTYDSALDVMSNSSAARAADPSRRDAPDTLAIDRLISGWIGLDRTITVTGEADVHLTPSNTRTTDKEGRSVTGDFVLILPAGRSAFVTVEALSNTGYDSHLPDAGVAVHTVTSKRGEIYRVVPEFGSPPFDHLLGDGQRVEANGWTIAVSRGSDGHFSVHVRRQQ
jgi:hypothetical protein